MNPKEHITLNVSRLPSNRNLIAPVQCITFTDFFQVSRDNQWLFSVLGSSELEMMAMTTRAASSIVVFLTE